MTILSALFPALTHTMKNKEMSMNDYRAMYAEYCLEVGDHAHWARDAGIDLRPESFTDFVVWRKRVEKYFENNKDSS